MIKLGTPVKDSATALKGMLVNMQVHPNGQRFYNFQARGLNPKTNQPRKRFWITADRIVGGVEIPDPDLPLKVLGTIVEDIASGFKGTATAMTLHINGCVHFCVQPEGTQSDSGEVIEEADFDIRQLKGKAIKPLDDASMEQSKKSKPSPIHTQSSKPRPI